MDTFWKWLIRGSGLAPPGIRNIFNAALFGHVAIALTASVLGREPINRGSVRSGLTPLV
jgi:hypothetical protein